jgi:hypothetical protein
MGRARLVCFSAEPKSIGQSVRCASWFLSVKRAEHDSRPRFLMQVVLAQPNFPPDLPLSDPFPNDDCARQDNGNVGGEVTTTTPPGSLIRCLQVIVSWPLCSCLECSAETGVTQYLRYPSASLSTFWPVLSSAHSSFLAQPPQG